MSPLHSGSEAASGDGKARYLTPAKLALLVLLELYTEENVPSNAVLPVLSFLSSHVLDHGPSDPYSTQASRWSKAERAVSFIVSMKDFEKVLASYPFLMGMPGRTLWDQFLGRIWELNSLDALHTFFERIPLLLARPKEEHRESGEGDDPEDDDKVRLSPNSPFGAFIRRAQLGFERLQFHDCAILWKDFVKYRQPTASQLRRKNPAFGRLSFDNVLQLGEQEDWSPDGVSALVSLAYGDMLTEDHDGTIAVSTNDVELLLEFQIEQMQKYGNRIPVEIRRRFQDLVHHTVVVPSMTHYLRFLDAWRAGDYTTAFDCLHRYFDYTIQYRDRIFYQYALMNLAVLQADFGCFKDAVSAMLETVSTARENRDLTCLNFALNWLFHFGRAHPELAHYLERNTFSGTGKETLAFLRVKARETGMWTLWSSVLLSEAKISLINGESLATSFEYVTRSSQVIVEKNLKSMFGSHMSLQTAIWNRLGMTHLSILNSTIFLHCYARHSIFDDELKHTCRLAAALADRGRYGQALETLEGLEANSLRSWKPGQHWLKYRSIIKLKRDLHLGNLDDAGEILAQILQSKSDDLEPEMAFLLDNLHIDYLSRRGDFQAAFACMEALASDVYDDTTDIAPRVKLLLLEVALLDKCGRPQRAFSAAVQAASLAWRARLIPCLWQAVGALANILVSLGGFDAAVQLLHAILPRALECEKPSLTAQLYGYLADANMGLAGDMPAKSSKRLEYMNRASDAVQLAFDHYSSIEDHNRQCEMMAKKAVIMKLTGEVTLAASFAAAYVKLKEGAGGLGSGGEVDGP